jgi:signal transduction histidine kinase
LKLTAQPDSGYQSIASRPFECMLFWDEHRPSPTGEHVQMLVETARGWPHPRAVIAASIDRPGLRRFAVATAIVGAWVAALVVAMAVWSPAAIDPSDPTPRLLHPFLQPILTASLGIAGSWLVRAWSPATGWILMILSLQVLAEPFDRLPNWDEPPTRFLISGLPAAMATIAALYASDPVRRLGRWVTPTAALLVAWFWLGVALALPQLTSVEPDRLQLPWWWDLARIPREGWIPGLLVVLGLAGDGRRTWPSLRRWAEFAESARPVTSMQRRWFAIGVAIAVGLVVTATTAMVAFVMAGGITDWIALPLAAIAAVLVASLLRYRLRPVAWLLLWGAGYVSMIFIGAFVYGPDPDWASADAAVATNLVAIACGAVVLIGTLYASEPGRRLGRWVLWAGIAVTVWAVGGFVAWTAWYLASGPSPTAEPWLASTARAPVAGDVALPFLFALPLLGIAGDLRPSWRRTRSRIAREPVSPTGWPAIFIDELIPGRENGRRSAAEAERVRLAGDLHAQILPALNLVLAESAAGASPERLADHLRVLERDMRGIVAERRLVILEEFGIVQALEWLAERAEERAPVAVELTVDPSTRESRPPRDVERAAFRVAQLALDNALLHAEPSRVSMEVLADGLHLRIRVEDDGQGLAPGASERAARANHQGMADMRLQAELVQARLDVSSARPGGTVVLFDWAGA